MKKILLSVAFALMVGSLSAQSYYNPSPSRGMEFPVMIQSHNDYRQEVPLLEAYSQGASLIEADLYIRDGELVVAHDRDEVATAPTLDSIYLKPLAAIFKSNNGRPWKDSEQTITLLIDPKERGQEVCDMLLAKYKQMPELFDSSVNKYAVRTIVSGSRPAVENFVNYPKNYMLFDGIIGVDYTKEQLSHVGLISASIKDYSVWNGKGVFVERDRKAVQEAIDYAHNLGKPIRFWATADCPNSWLTLHKMGVDVINTDMPAECAIFFSDFHKKSFELTQEIDTPYQPSYKSDGSNKMPKNIIFIIGDGMSLPQITAAETVVGQMAVTQIRQIGLQRTSALDSYITDSAGAGSALMTGSKHNNRHISAAADGTPSESLSEALGDRGYGIGFVTGGDISDATPAAVYAHHTERDSSQNIVGQLLDSNVSVAVGAGEHHFNKRWDGRNIFSELKAKGFEHYSSVEDIASGDGDKVICIDSELNSFVKDEDDMARIANSMVNAVEVLERGDNKGYFIMVEVSRIDYAGHSNDVRHSVIETLNMDRVVSHALELADKDGETLVVVTGDHETGGMTIVGGEKGKSVVVLHSSNDHTAIMIPVFAYGPRSQDFSGVYENTKIPQIFKSIMK